MLTSFAEFCDQIESLFFNASSKDASRPIWPIASLNGDDDGQTALDKHQREWLKAAEFKAQAGSCVLLPGTKGLAGVAFGIGSKGPGNGDPLLSGLLPALLPGGNYHHAGKLDNPQLAALAWGLGSYDFGHYQAEDKRKPRCLRFPEGVDRKEVVNTAAAIWLGRDLINIPSNDLGPAELESAAQGLAEHFGAAFEVTSGDALLTKNFPLIHAVGRASSREPRLIDFRWGNADAPKVTIIGKGICFDTGGLNLKPGSSMSLMKKDMGGAASALALAAMIMSADLNIRLRVLIPAAENSVSSNAFRPGDVLRSRAGISVEIGNTDAEGRLVLADALALADEEKPDLLMTFATLTGAARVALGPDLPPFYSTDDQAAEAIYKISKEIGDPLWRMPFWSPYDQMLESRTADINNISSEPFAGSIVAALFLKRFVKKAAHYLHFDIYGWTPRPLPGKAVGGEPQGARAVYEYLRGKFPQA